MNFHVLPTISMFRVFSMLFYYKTLNFLLSFYLCYIYLFYLNLFEFTAKFALEFMFHYFVIIFLCAVWVKHSLCCIYVVFLVSWAKFIINSFGQRMQKFSKNAQISRVFVSQIKFLVNLHGVFLIYCGTV